MGVVRHIYLLNPCDMIPMEYKASLIKSTELNYIIKSFRFTRASEFDFKAGQFFYIRLNKNLLKHFTLSNSPTEKDYIQLTTKMTGSEFKNALNALKPGDQVDINGPYGEFTYDTNFKKIAFLSGGIGITPIRSICRYITDNEIDCEITLVYGNNQERDIVFKKEFDEMISRNSKLKVVHVLSNPGPEWTGHKGFITKDIVKHEIPDLKERVFYTCGPPAMVLAMNNVLDELKVEKQNIKLENFVGY